MPSYAERYLNNPDLPLPDPRAAEREDLPAFLRHKREHDSREDHDAVLWQMNPTEAQLRRLRAYYCANVTMIDEALGDLLDVLQRKGYLDESLIVFTSDHGDNLGDHGLSQKWSMYDTVVRVPLIVWAPGEVPAGLREAGLCQLFDVGPTLLEWAGAPLPPACQARSLLPALRGDTWSAREMVFAEQAGDVVLTGARLFSMARDTRHKLVHILDSPDGQLFDLQADPFETRNLWASAAHRAERDKLLHALLDWRVRSSADTMSVMAHAR